MTIATGMLARYLDALDSADPSSAIKQVERLLDDGVEPVDVLLDLVAVAQREVGERWRTARWSVAQEHAATHVSEQVVAAVAARIRVDPSRGRVVMACVEGEWHALAARLVAEVVRADGWSVAFLGASVPSRHLVSYLHQTGPDAVLVSCIQPAGLVRAARTIEACRLAGVPVIAGGPGFGPHGRWARPLGAAAWGADARDAVRLLAEADLAVIEVGPSPAAAGDEHVAVLGRRRDLVDAATRALRPEDDHHDVVAAEVGQLVDALAAAIRVGDPDLVTDFARWQSEVMVARQIPVAGLHTVLRTFGTLLADHPQARSYLQRVSGGLSVGDPPQAVRAAASSVAPATASNS